jgi:hypothetical protein
VNLFCSSFLLIKEKKNLTCAAYLWGTFLKSGKYFLNPLTKACWLKKAYLYLNFMKAISTLIFFTCLSLQSFSQSLEGEWKGSFTYGKRVYFSDYDMPVDISNSISLYFKLNKDSSYTVYSYSRGKDVAGKDTIVVCKVLYRKTSPDSLYLEETEVLKPANAEAACFQKMYLKIKKEKKLTVLDGTWQTEKECKDSGKIKFIRKD